MFLAEKLLQSPSIKLLKRGFKINKGTKNLEFTELEVAQDEEDNEAPEKALAGDEESN